MTTMTTDQNTTVQEQDNRPEMTATEASFHQNAAGIRARNAAASQGGDPKAAEAIMDGARGSRIVAGIALHPVTLEILWALQLVKPALADPTGPQTLNGDELALMAYVFHDPGTAYDLAKAKDGATLLDNARELTRKFTVEDIQAVSDYTNGQLHATDKQGQATAARTTEPGKPQPPASSTPPSASPTTTDPVPQPDPAGPSPSSSSSSPNTTKAYEVPSASHSSPPGHSYPRARQGME